MKPVTDPKILEQLNAQPEIPAETLAKLNAPFEFSAAETMSNIPADAARVGGQMLDMFMSPVQTLNAIKNFSIGVAQKAYPGEQDYEQYADAVWQSLVDSYGSFDKALQSLQERPVETAMDALSLVTGGAGLTRAATSKLVPQAAEIAGKVQAASDPFNVAKRVTQKGVAAVKGKTQPKEMWVSAVKPYKKFDDADIEDAADLSLTEQIMPTPSGMKKLDRQMIRIGDQIDKLIETAENTGQRIPYPKFFKPVRELRNKWQQSSRPEAFADVKALDAYMKSYLAQLKKQQKTDIPKLSPKQLQEVKTELYRLINFDRTQQTTRLPIEQTRKALARGSRESIEGLAPGISEANQAWGRRANLREILDGPVARIQNRDLVGIGVPMKATAGAVMGGDFAPLTGLLGATMGALDAPTNKVRAAMALNRWGQMPILTPANVPSGMAAYLASQLPQTEEF